MSMSRTARKWLVWSSVTVVTLAAFAALAWWLFIGRLQLYPHDVMRRANEIQERILSFDSHIDIQPRFGTPGNEANKDGRTQFDLVKAARGRLSGAALTVWAWPEFWNGAHGPHRPTAGFVEAARHEQETRYRIITGIARDFPNQAGIAYTPADFRRLAHEGKFAIVISMLNAYPLGDDVSRLDDWAARGMRIFGFSYVANNAWADSSRPMPFFGDSPDEHGGLSELGRQAVRRLNDLGVVIDVSQMSSLALEQVVQLTRAPVIASHSSVKGLVDLQRNLSDKELRMIRDTGGVVQIPGFSSYLKAFSEQTLEKINKMRADFGLPKVQNLSQASMPADPVFSIWPEQRFGDYASALYAILDEDPRATLKDFGDAIDYAVKKIGIDHVGISSDFNDGGGIVGWENVGDTRNVTAELLQRGYSEEDIAKLWGGNFLRVWEQVQRHAAPAPAPAAVQKP
ncbi:dipeptidase [Pseudomonas sp. DTU_2021_1001937_2_SI_NGA_ILE_001]|uniref:dipeptidase n=1 Tax=Pseudomonas sp. DTU_2021_1001937_2_SI_NGA_ILE_001 TaxID=3077589 RepID=UPI0028FC2D75|nr:dipeptidase [Pseudomonas sp. DTU_2021_1001937_2_SI_NGA_ILE_001]WNW11872.1 dipeptidase [Pseudomonas sp. DTU_2021_1001937_2_SI_NGA_ILE_001]